MHFDRSFWGIVKEFSRFVQNPNFINSRRFADSLQLLISEPKYYDLQKSFYQIVEKSKSWDAYDYNQGYFYHSFPSGKIGGLRDTAIRIQEYKLCRELHDKRVLNIGCNLGFLDCELNSFVNHIDAFDINPYLIEIAKLAKKFLCINNVEFYVCSFEEYNFGSSYDVVLSFANHSTYDGKTRHTIYEYFQKISKLLNNDGILLLESHAPLYEKNFDDILKIVETLFYVDSQFVLNKGTPFDVGRKFIKAYKR